MQNRNYQLRLQILAAALLALALPVVLAGCGGGGNPTSQSNRTGQVSLRIVWPAKETSKSASRYIPPYAPSLFFELYAKNAPDKRYSLIVNRPDDRPSTQTAAFSQLLNEGDYVLAGAARAQADGQGDTVASVVRDISVKAGINPVEMIFNSTIKSLQVIGQPLSATIGKPITLPSGAFDPDGRSLLLPPGALVWSVVSGSQFGTITPAGVLTPIAAGTLRVRAAETGIGVSAEADVVVSNVSVALGLKKNAYPKEYGDAKNTGFAKGKGAVGTPGWTFELGSYYGIQKTPIIGGNGMIYAVGADPVTGAGYGYGLRASDGTLVWKTYLKTITPGSPTLLSDDTLCFPLGASGVVGLDALTGVEKWRGSDPNAISSASTANADEQGHLYSGGTDGLYRIDATNGNSTELLHSGQIGTTPAIGSDGTVYYVTGLGGSLDGKLVAYNPTSNLTLWTASNIYLYSSPMIAPNGWVYVIGRQASTGVFSVVAFDPLSGAMKAELQDQFVVQYRFTAPACDADGNIFLAKGSQLVSLSPNLTQIWESPRFTDSAGIPLYARRVAVGSDGTVYVTADRFENGTQLKVYAFNGKDGTKLWESTLFGQVLGSLSIDSDGVIYGITAKGTLFTIK